MPKIVYIDTQKVFQAHSSARAAVKKLQGEQQKMQQKLEGLEGKQAQMMGQNLQQKLQERRNELMNQAFEELRRDIEAIAEDQGYDYVVDRNMLLAGGEDVTEEVIGALK